jgi:hypothetical protein
MFSLSLARVQAESESSGPRIVRQKYRAPRSRERDAKTKGEMQGRAESNPKDRAGQMSRLRGIGAQMGQRGNDHRAVRARATATSSNLIKVAAACGVAPI